MNDKRNFSSFVFKCQLINQIREPIFLCVQKICDLKNRVVSNVISKSQAKYSKVPIIRPGRFRLLEFEQKLIICTSRLIETFSKCPDQAHLL